MVNPGRIDAVGGGFSSFGLNVNSFIPAGSGITLRAFDSGDNMLAEKSIVSNGVWDLLEIDQTDLLGAVAAYVEVSSDFGYGVDDVRFVVKEAAAACGADINGDGVVNCIDLGLLLGAWGQCNP